MGDKHHCRICGTELNENNSHKYNVKHRDYICISCRKRELSEWRIKNKENIKISNQKHYRKNRESILKKNTVYNRNHRITTTDENGKQITIKTNKRKHTLICELCGRESTRTSYHHWDDLNPQWGMWICMRCHKFVEMVECGLHETYFELKRKIEIGDM